MVYNFNHSSFALQLQFFLLPCQRTNGKKEKRSWVLEGRKETHTHKYHHFLSSRQTICVMHVAIIITSLLPLLFLAYLQWRWWRWWCCCSSCWWRLETDGIFLFFCVRIVLSFLLEQRMRWSYIKYVGKVCVGMHGKRGTPCLLRISVSSSIIISSYANNTKLHYILRKISLCTKWEESTGLCAVCGKGIIITIKT